jgi:hypothetical protein
MGVLLLVSACKGAPAEIPPSDAPYVRSDSAAPAQPPKAASTVSGPLNSHLAQSLGMEYVAERWGYHPRMATAYRMPTGAWRVTVILQEPRTIATVYYDNGGTVLDAGVVGAADP